MIKNIIKNLKQRNSLPKKLEDVIKYYNEHWEVDPNVYEYIELTKDAIDYVYSNYTDEDFYYLTSSTESKNVYKNIYKLGIIIKERLLNKNLCDSESPLYKMVDKMIEYSEENHKLTDTQANASKKVAGVLLFIYQMQRYYKSFQPKDENPKHIGYKYKNIEEFKELCELIQKAESEEKKEDTSFIEIRRDAFDLIAYHFDRDFVRQELNSAKVKQLTKKKTFR